MSAEDNGCNNSLLVRDLLKQTFIRLGENNSLYGVILPRKALSEIANDSDWHRTREGYMGYEGVTLLQFGDEVWAVGNGKACGSYPADPFSSDILAIRIERLPSSPQDKQFADSLVSLIERTSYFSNSLIFGLSDGRLATPNNPLGERMFDSAPNIPDFIAQELETRSDVIHLDLRPVVSSAVKYKPELVDYLTTAIETVLRMD